MPEPGLMGSHHSLCAVQSMGEQHKQHPLMQVNIHPIKMPVSAQPIEHRACLHHKGAAARAVRLWCSVCCSACLQGQLTQDESLAHSP